jgi:hypothetical protein
MSWHPTRLPRARVEVEKWSCIATLHRQSGRYKDMKESLSVLCPIQRTMAIKVK